MFTKITQIIKYPNQGIEIENNYKKIFLKFNYIDKKKKIGRFILFNTPINFNIKDMIFHNYEGAIDDWLYSFKEFKNKIELTCHAKKENKKEIREEEKLILGDNLKDLKNQLDKILNEEIVNKKKFIKLGSKIIEMKEILKKKFI